MLMRCSWSIERTKVAAPVTGGVIRSG
jgi:hypothetical protein